MSLVCNSNVAYVGPGFTLEHELVLYGAPLLAPALDSAHVSDKACWALLGRVHWHARSEPSQQSTDANPVGTTHAGLHAFRQWETEGRC